MATVKLVAGGVSSWTSISLTAADFNSLADGSFVLLDGTIDNSSNLDLLAEIAGTVTVGGTTVARSIMPVFLHLGIVLMLGLYIPPYLTRWFHEAAKMLG